MREPLADLYRRARSTDPVSAFGGIVGLNAEVDAETATGMGIFRFDADGSGTWLPLVHGQGALVAANGFAPKTVPEIIAEARAKPGTVSCATPGSLPTVGCALLQSYAGVPMILGRIVEELHNVAMNNHGAGACSNILIKDFEQRAKTRVTK